MKNAFAGAGRGYLDGPPRQVPGFASLHRMVEMLLAERVPPEGRVLVLRPGAPLLLMHISFPQTEPERSEWIARHAAYGAPLGTNPAHLAAARDAIGTRLTILSPDEDEAMLAEAGFERISLFFAGLTFRGWVSYSG